MGYVHLSRFLMGFSGSSVSLGLAVQTPASWFAFVFSVKTRLSFADLVTLPVGSGWWLDRGAWDFCAFQWGRGVPNLLAMESSIHQGWMRLGFIRVFATGFFSKIRGRVLDEWLLYDLFDFAEKDCLPYMAVMVSVWSTLAWRPVLLLRELCGDGISEAVAFAFGSMSDLRFLWPVFLFGLWYPYFGTVL